MWIYPVIGILCLIGAAVILFVVKRIIETVGFVRSAAKTEGRVIYLAPTRSSDRHLMYLPVFEYRTNDGTVYRHTSTVASTPPAYKVGETVTLLYLKKNPRNAKIESFTELWLVTVVLVVIGFSCFGGALVVYFGAR